jgi:hypothetical protein
MSITFCGAEGLKITRDRHCLAEVARSGNMYIVRSTAVPLATFTLERKNRAYPRTETVNLLRLYHKQSADMPVARRRQDNRTTKFILIAARSPTKTAPHPIMFGKVGPIGPITVIMPKSGEPAEGFRNRVRGLENWKCRTSGSS